MVRTLNLNEAKGLANFAQELLSLNELLKSPKNLSALIQELEGAEGVIEQTKEVLQNKYDTETLAAATQKRINDLEKEKEALNTKIAKFNDDRKKLDSDLYQAEQLEKKAQGLISENEKKKSELEKLKKDLEEKNALAAVIISDNTKKQENLDKLIAEYNKKLDALKVI